MVKRSIENPVPCLRCLQGPEHAAQLLGAMLASGHLDFFKRHQTAYGADILRVGFHPSAHWVQPLCWVSWFALSKV